MALADVEMSVARCLSAVLCGVGVLASECFPELLPSGSGRWAGCRRLCESDSWIRVLCVPFRARNARTRCVLC